MAFAIRRNGTEGKGRSGQLLTACTYCKEAFWIKEQKERLFLLVSSYRDKRKTLLLDQMFWR